MLFNGVAKHSSFMIAQVLELSRILIFLLILLVSETFFFINFLPYWRRVVEQLSKALKNDINTLIIGAGEGAGEKLFWMKFTNNKLFGGIIKVLDLLMMMKRRQNISRA